MIIYGSIYSLAQTRAVAALQTFTNKVLRAHISEMRWAMPVIFAPDNETRPDVAHNIDPGGFEQNWQYPTHRRRSLLYQHTAHWIGTQHAAV